MSLYQKSNSELGFEIGDLLPSSKFPKWMLVLSIYSAIIILTNTIPGLINISIGDLINPQLTGYILSDITSLLSIAPLALVIFRNNLLCIYYLIMTSFASLALTFALIGRETENLSPYFHSLKGLEFIPEELFLWLVFNGKLGITAQSIVAVVDSVFLVIFCALMLYFHNNRQKIVQVP
jgi:hypothetical protein